MKKSRHASWTMQQALDFARKNNNADLLRQLNEAAKPARPLPTLPQEAFSGQKGTVAPGKPPKAKKPRAMNQTERQFFEILKRRHPNAEVLYEKYTFKLANDLRYTPDFAVVFRDQGGIGVVILYEVKGSHIFSRALHKPKIAAEQFRHRFVLAQKIDGAWHETPLPGKIDT